MLTLSGNVSKWLTMRELIRAEERLTFARHSHTQQIRKGSRESASRQTQPESDLPRVRLTCRKELY